MKEKILRFIKRLLNIRRPSCMTCLYGDFGDESGPCRGCDVYSDFIHYKEEK